MTNTSAFIDLPHEIRFAFITAVESIGCEWSTYEGLSAQVRVGNAPDARQRLESIARCFGLVPSRTDDWQYWYFPRPSNLPAHLQHDGHYPGSKGFTLSTAFRPKTDTDDRLTFKGEPIPFDADERATS